MINAVSVENMRKSDENTVKNVSAVTLMERAAVGILDNIKKYSLKPPFAIVCGVGNNAGDGYALAELMFDAGIDCTVFTLNDRFSDSGKYYFDRCKEKGVKISRELDLDGFCTVVDCIFGIGFHGEMADEYKEAVRKINSSRAFVVSADINSGLCGDNGLYTDCVVLSDLTVSIGDYKVGHFLNSAKDVMKAKENADIGIKLLDGSAKVIEAVDIRRLFVREKNDSNKGDFGYVALIGGSVDYSGAVKLANLSLSALRSGAGVAKLAVPEGISSAVLPYLLESTLYRLDEKDGKYCFSRETAEKLIRNTKAVAVGMGMGRSGELKRLLQYLIHEYDGRLIIDADGLNELSELDLDELKKSRAKLILTPHLKEFERLYKISIPEIKKDPIKYAVEYARSTGATVLLKGPTTVVTDGEKVYLTDRGTVGMSTAGSGDVLSGILCGICGYANDEDLLLSVAAGAYVNGYAGELASKDVPPVSMLSSDTVRQIPNAIAEILKS